MLTDIKMLFFNIRHTYLLASPPESQTDLDYGRQCHDDSLALWSVSEQRCHIKALFQIHQFFRFHFKAPTFLGLTADFTLFYTEWSRMWPLAHPLRMWTQTEVEKVKPTIFYSSQQIVMEVATLQPQAPPSYTSKTAMVLRTIIWKCHLFGLSKRF